MADASGTIRERYRYTVYGDVRVLNADFTPKGTNDALSPFLWGGSYRDAETGLYWMRNRYYHTDMKRFINSDPIGIWGDANNLGNGFAYVAGMVVEHKDPTGLCEVETKHTIIYTVILPDVSDVEFTATAIPENYSGGRIFSKNEDIQGSLMVSFSKDIPNNPIVVALAMAICCPLPEGYTHEQIEENKKRNTFWVGGIYGYFDPDGVFHLDQNKNGIDDYDELSEEEKKRLQEEDPFAEEGSVDSEEDSTSGAEGYLDPDNPFDRFQAYFSRKTIEKILAPRLKEPRKKSEPRNIEDWEKNPIVPYKGDDGSRQFIRNPFYREPALLFQLFIEYENEDGKKKTILNPFRAPQPYDRTSRYERMRQERNWFYMPEVDPWYY